MTPKEAAGRCAAEYIEAGMIVGLGTGSTAEWAIRALGERVATGLAIKAIPTSAATAALARALDIELTTLAEVARVDLTIDGADEVDPSLDLIKGLGGALLREKVVASITERQIIVAGPSKLVARLGTKAPLPVEVVPWSHPLVARGLKERGLAPALRLRAPNIPYVTDNGNYVIDARFPAGIDDARATEHWLNALPGVVENGLFVGLTHLVVVGQDDGSCHLLNKS